MLAGCSGPVTPPAAEPDPAPAAAPASAAQAAAAHAAAAPRDAAVAAIALIVDNKQRCLAIARDGVQKLQQDEQDRARGSRFHTFVRAEAKQRLSVSKAVDNLIRDLQPKVQRPESPQISEAVSGLVATQQQLCRDAAYEWTSAADYDARIADAVYEFEKANNRARSLVRASEDEYRQALARYFPALQAAEAQAADDPVARSQAESWRTDQPRQPDLTAEQIESKRREWAEAQRLKEQQEAAQEAALEALRHPRSTPAGDAPLPKLGAAASPPIHNLDAPDAPASAELRSWYRAYSIHAEAVKMAISRFNLVADGGDEQFLQPACKELQTSTQRLLADRAAFASPDVALNHVLERAYRRFATAANACVLSDLAAAKTQLAAGQQQLDQAAEILRPYRLLP
jgi:hypothetical protein